jgi:hypothetical protein
MLVNTVILVFNIVFGVVALLGFLAYLQNKKQQFTYGMFANVYWLVIGCYYGWWANIAITIYFFGVNQYGYAKWHELQQGGKVIKNVWLVLALMLTVALYINILTGFKGVAAIINFGNVCLYGFAYTLRLYPKHKRVCNALFATNSAIYLPTMAFANPILWGCVVKQTIYIIANCLFAICPNCKACKAILGINLNFAFKVNKKVVMLFTKTK